MGCAGVNDDYIAWFGDIQRLMDHQVVTWIDFHRARGSASLMMLAAETADLRIDGVEPVEQIGNIGRGEAPKALHELQRKPLDVHIDAETRPGVQVRGSRFVDHCFTPYSQV